MKIWWPEMPAHAHTHGFEYSQDIMTKILVCILASYSDGVWSGFTVCVHRNFYQRLKQMNYYTRRPLNENGLPTVARSILGSSNILSWRLVMESFLRPLFPWRCSKKGSCQLLAKRSALSTGKRVVSLPRNRMVRLTDRHDMTIVVDWDVKPQIKQNKNLNC